MRIKLVLQVVGFLQVFTGAMMVLPLIVSALYGEGVTPMMASVLISIVFGGLIAFFCRSDEDLRVREGFAIVTFGWMAAALFGSLPYLISGAIPSFTDAYFETLSGFTTTGASVLTEIESLPRGILLWRSQTQWLGGMGIIVLSIAILPFLGIGGMQLFKAEVPGPTPDRLKPRISHTAGLLWVVYLLLTALEVLLLRIGEMDLFDAVNHAFTTMATGGFSTRNASVGAYGAYSQYIITLFMFLAGVNFALHYRFLMSAGKFSVFTNDREWVFYVIILLGATGAVYLANVSSPGYEHGELAFRDSVFQVVSITTTTGYATADFDAWHSVNRLILFSLMFVGGCAGSTGGGMKVIRLLLILKQGKTELKKLLHPQGVFIVKVKRIKVRPEVMLNVQGFFTLYIAIFVFCSFLMAALGLDIVTAASSVAATLGNIGPGLAGVGPMANFSQIPDLGKWILSVCMLLGRLELYTVLILFMPEVWRKY